MSLSRNDTPTFEQLVSYSFHTYIDAYNSIVKDPQLFSISTNVLFHSYVKLCTTLGGVFIFQNEGENVTLGFLPFKEVKGLMVGGDNDGNMVKYDTSSQSKLTKVKGYLE